MAKQAPKTVVLIRRAVADDADGITRIYIESAEYHAGLDSERYLVPPVETILARYQEGRQHPPGTPGEYITFVAQLGDGIVGFIDARLYESLDAMHREMTFCFISEIAVSREHQNHGIGGQLLRAAEDWGRQQGAEFALLEYHAANTRASTFYQQHMGYQVASITTIKRL